MKIASALSETDVRRTAADAWVKSFQDALAVEEPLEIRVGFWENSKRTLKAISITMRTPGDDVELAAGFLFTEGIIKTPEQKPKTDRTRSNWRTRTPFARIAMMELKSTFTG